MTEAVQVVKGAAIVLSNVVAGALTRRALSASVWFGLVWFSGLLTFVCFTPCVI